MVDYVFTPVLPKYSEAQAAVKFLNGKSIAEISDMQKKINSQTGDPQNIVDWSKPNEWIPKRLTGRPKELAMELWEGSEGDANPRYLWRPNLFASWQKLLQRDDCYSITREGKNFVKGDDATIKTIDSKEGVDFLLNKINEYQPCKKANLLEPWEKFLKNAEAKIKKNSSTQYSLWCRLSNLLHRELIERNGIAYSVTQKGEKYLYTIDKYHHAEKDKILEQVKKLKNLINKKILDNVKKIEAKDFEYFVEDLLIKMGYEDTDVTPRSGDGGIDITAKKAVELTEINYVFQVKRWQYTIQRPAIQGFAGAMDGIEKADMGVFITTSKFSSGAKDAADNMRKQSRKTIILIDGDKLVELIKEYKIGIEKETIEIYNIDNNYFEQNFEECSYRKTLDETKSQKS